MAAKKRGKGKGTGNESPAFALGPAEARVVTLAQVQKEQATKSPRVKRVTRATLTNMVAKALNTRLTLTGTPVMELTARHPHDPAGLMDFYRPGRWDCTANLVFMNVIITGPNPGEWEGTVGYARFQAPTAGTYLVVANFAGLDITMKLHGPWGTTTAFSPTPADSAAVTAMWTGTAGQNLFFTVNCTGPIIGYLESIQVFDLS
jgi:hypothetical protein